MKKIVLAIAVLVAGFLLYVLWAGFGADPHAVPFMMTGKKAPLFKMKDLRTGEEVSLADHLGKPIVLNFWATWCGPCKVEHPVLEWAGQRYAGQVVFLGIVFEDNEENTKRFLQENGGTWQQLYDPKSTVAVDYGAAGVPETFFIDRNGNIVERYPYPFTRPEELDARIQKILVK